MITKDTHLKNRVGCSWQYLHITRIFSPGNNCNVAKAKVDYFKHNCSASNENYCKLRLLLCLNFKSKTACLIYWTFWTKIPNVWYKKLITKRDVKNLWLQTFFFTALRSNIFADHLKNVILKTTIQNNTTVYSQLYI
jgi:hypothetical protein